ncbi:MAG: hypothetical protein P4M00_01970 [Azospirillaceae bacterium]|nr:hypothetical protein [Azospirillaceae bacterium]
MPRVSSPQSRTAEPGPDRTAPNRTAPDWTAPDWTAVVIAAAFCVLLLGLGVPRLVSAILAQPANAVLWQAYHGETVSPAALRRAATALDAANRWLANGEALDDESFLLSQAAIGTPPGDDRAALDARAERTAITALTRAPGQPNAWARLAGLREQRQDTGGAVAALRLSMLSGALVPALMPSRIAQAIRLRAVLDADTLSLVKRQIRLTAAVAPGFIAALRADPNSAPLVDDALTGATGAGTTDSHRLDGSGNPAP